MILIFHCFDRPVALCPLGRDSILLLRSPELFLTDHSVRFTYIIAAYGGVFSPGHAR